MKNLFALLVWARAARTNAVCAMFALMLLFVFASPAAAQVAINETNFPDAAFRQYVRTQFDKDNNGTLSESELNAVTAIGSSTAGTLPAAVADLTGIKLFPKLKELYAISTATAVKNLDVSGITTLTTLKWYGSSEQKNQLTNLNASGCTALTTLWCHNNQLTSLNVSGCTALTKLENYQYQNNPLQRLDASNCTALTSVEIINSPLVSLNVSGCTALTTLTCYRNKLTKLDVTSCPKLKTLRCYENEFTNFEDIHFDVSSLETLDCSSNKFTSLTIKESKTLKDLKCDSCPNLKEVSLIGCEALLYDAKMPRVVHENGFSCVNNPELTSVDLRGSKIDFFFCEQNSKLEQLDISACEIKYLHCANNSNLKKLEVSHNPTLEWLTCLNDPLLKSVNLSNCPNFKAARNGAVGVDNMFDHNQASLDMSNCTALQYFYCVNKSLTNLNMRGCTALVELSVTGNQLESLDVRGCLNLIKLQCYKNRLRDLKLDPTMVYDAAKSVYKCKNNYLPLSLLYSFRANETYKQAVLAGTRMEDHPQSDTTYLSVDEAWDLSSEGAFGPEGKKAVTKYTVYDPATGSSGKGGNMGTDKTVTGSFTFTQSNGQFKFLKAGDYRIVLTNDSVRWGTSKSTVSFTWIVKVMPADDFCEVQLRANPEVGGSAAGARRYKKNDSVRIAAPAYPGYRFVNWTHNEGGAVFGTRWDTTFNITENLNLKANFVKAYTILTTANDATMGKVSGRGEYDTNADVTVTATPESNARFLRWKKGETVVTTDNAYPFKATENVTLTAEFEWIKYTIGVQSNNTEWGTASINSKDGVYRKGDEVVVTATPKPRYRLKAWKNAAGETVYDKTPYKFNATESTTLTAEFELTTYPVTVKVEPAEGGSVSGNKGTYEEGAYFTLSATPSEGYRFKEWRKDGKVLEGTEKECHHSVVEPTVITAVFELIPVYAITVQANASDKGTVEINSQPSRDMNSSNRYREGDAITITARAADKHYFVCWKDAADAVFSKMRDTTFEAKADLTLTAEFAVIPANAVRVTVKPNGFSLGEAAITGDGVYEPGTEVTITATEKEGGRFVNWRRVVGNNKVEFATTPTHTFTVTENMELWAYFVNRPPHDITVKANKDDRGTVKIKGTWDGVEHDHGRGAKENAEIVIEAKAKDGCHFVQWQYVDYDAGIEVFTKKADTTFKAYRSFVLTAVFDSNTYKITALPESDDMGIVTGSGTYNEQANVTVTATAKEGYRFKEWRAVTADAEADAAADPLSLDAIYTFKAIKDLTLKARFNEFRYDITVQANDGNWGEVSGGGSVQEGKEVKINAEAKAHCRFVKWIHTQSKEEFTTKTDTAFKAKENLDLTAVFEPITYKITVKSDNPQWGNTTPNGEKMEYQEGKKVTVMAVPRSADYRFVRWKDGKTDQVISRLAQYDFTVQEDKELVAVFEEATWNVIVQYDNTLGSVSITAANGQSAPYRHNTEITVTATPKEGCRFVAWKEGVKQVSDKKTYTFNIVREMNLTAEFERIPVYTITVQANDNGMGGVTGGGSYREDSTVIIEATAKPGHYFVKWVHVATDETFTKMKRHTFKAKEDLALKAVFEAIPDNAIKIRVRSADTTQGYALITGDSIHKIGDEVTISVAPKIGHKFVDWKIINGTDRTVFTQKPDTTFVVREDMELWAYFVNEPPHTIVVSANNDDWGEVEMVAEKDGNGKVPVNADVKISAEAKPGYRFVNWMYIDREDIEEVFTTKSDTLFKATQDLTLTAYFEPITYTVTVLSSDDVKGMVYQSGEGLYEEGSVVTVYAVAHEGYGFSAWMKGEEPVSLYATYTFEVHQDLTLTAYFEELPYHRITVSSNIANAGILSGDGLYKENTMATLSATAKVGYRFVHWKKDDQVFCTKPDTTFMVTEAMSFVAYFDSVMYTVAVQTANADMGSVRGGGTYKGGTKAAISATPNEGYRFAKWKNGNADFGFSADTTFMVLENITLTAYFEEIPVVEDPSYTITVRANDSTLGSALLDIGISSAIYKKDADVTIVAEPTGAKSFFVKWTRLDADGTETEFSTEPTYTFKAFDNLVLTACFDLRESDELGLYVKDRVIYLPEPMGKVQVFSTMGQFLYEGEGMAFRMARSGVFVLRIKGKNYKVLVP